MNGPPPIAIDRERLAALRAGLAGRSVVLVGMPGSGKTSVGRRLADQLEIEFIDADAEIEAAAGMSIAEIFEKYGEPYFRTGETRVLARLLEGGARVIATGGGAVCNPETRSRIRAHAVSIWLKAEFPVLLRRIKRKNNRPLFQTGDPEQTLQTLLAEREPLYAEADITVASHEGPHDAIVETILQKLVDRFAAPAERQSVPR